MKKDLVIKAFWTTSKTQEMLWSMSQRTWWCIQLCANHEGAHRDLLDS
jgi:hypothetical protein